MQLDNNKRSVSLVHKGNIMKFTEELLEIGVMNWLQANLVVKK